jgi:hypothetical protein
MSGFRDDDFQRRLSRISEQRPSAKLEPAIRSAKSKSSGGRGVAFSLFAVGIMPVLGLAGLLLLAEQAPKPDPDRPADYVEDNDRSPTLMALVGNPDRSEQPAVSARVGMISGRLGSELAADHAITADGTAIPMQSIMLPAAGDTGITPELRMFAANADCTLRRPLAGEKLVNVNIRGSAATAPISVLDDARVLDVLEAAAKDVLEEGGSFDTMPIDRGAMPMVDVYVTDTSAPLYLMLQTFSDDMMWAVHAAPGVRIAHVAMIAGGTSGVAGNIGDASVEAIRSDTYGHVHEDFHDQNPPESYTCMTLPFRNPDESWSAWFGAKQGNAMDGNLLFGQSNGYEAYAHWFRGAVGVGPDTHIVDAAIAPAALVGPAPAAPLAAAEAGKVIHIMQSAHVIAGNEAEREAQIIALYRDVLTDAAGGDPMAVMPPERSFADAAPAAGEGAAEGEGLFAQLAAVRDLDLMPSVSLYNSQLELRSSVEQAIPMTSLLTDGEAMPPEHLRELYAMLRAPRLTEGHCADTLVEIAISCRVSKVTVNALPDDLLQVWTDFTYVPRYAGGDLAEEHADGYNAAFLPEPDGTKTYATREDRRAFLQRLLRVCDVLRAERGNCHVEVTGFYLWRPAHFSGTSIETHAAGWVAVRGVENPYEQKLLQTRAEQIWAEVQ